MTHRECSVTGLPPEVAGILEGVVDPTGGGSLELSKERGHGRLLVECHEQMNVVGRAADLDRDSTFTADDPAEVFPQARADFRGNRWSPVLGAEHEMIVQTSVRLRHASLLRRRSAA